MSDDVAAGVLFDPVDSGPFSSHTFGVRFSFFRRIPVVSLRFTTG